MGNNTYFNLYCLYKTLFFNIFSNKSLQRLHFDLTRGGMSIKNRSRTDIAVDILRLAMKGSNNSRIVCEANVNFNIATKYLDML